MRMLQPLSEEFMYWDPEAICCYPLEDGPEDAWFLQQRKHIYVVVDNAQKGERYEN